jgi:hypothetical protein
LIPHRFDSILFDWTRLGSGDGFERVDFVYRATGQNFPFPPWLSQSAWRVHLASPTELLLPTDYPRPVPLRIVEAEFISLRRTSVCSQTLAHFAKMSNGTDSNTSWASLYKKEEKKSSE